MTTDRTCQVRGVERQQTLDVLRGFALLGILFVNYEFLA